MTPRLIERWLPIAELGEESIRERRAPARSPAAMRNAPTLLAAARKLEVDTKTGVLLDQLTALRKGGYRQALVFSQHTDTMDFLRGHLAAAGWKLLCFSGRGGEVQDASGSWRAVSRDDIKRMFRKGDAEILLCTDAAAEGLNFQFCGALVNYDMPWNPMRVEQRIGRIDRLGQGHPVIRIVNLHYDDTVETDVYRALRDRIGLFSRFIGRLQPILSSLPRGIQQATFTPAAGRERERAGLVSRVMQGVDQAEQPGFDLDEIAAADLDEPARAAALYGLADLGTVLRRADLLPPGVESKPLGGSEHQYSAPGMARPVRVTTDPAYYEQHPASVELWSPGSPVFPTPDSVASIEEVVASGGGLAELMNRDAKPPAE